MCFYAKSDNSRSKVVDGAITGFKRFKKRGDVLSSPYKKAFKWKFNELKVEEKFDKTADYGEVNVGFHCYKTYKEAIDKKQKGEKVYMVVIPSGARYHENDVQYCSNKMVVLDFELTKSKK